MRARRSAATAGWAGRRGLRLAISRCGLPKPMEFPWIFRLGGVADSARGNLYPRWRAGGPDVRHRREVSEILQCSRQQHRDAGLALRLGPQTGVAAWTSPASALTARVKLKDEQDGFTGQHLQRCPVHPHDQPHPAARTPLAVGAVTGVVSQRLRSELELDLTAEACAEVRRRHRDLLLRLNAEARWRRPP